MFHPVRAAHASVFLRYNCFSFADCNVSPRFPPYSNEPLNQLATCNAKIVALVAVYIMHALSNLILWRGERKLYLF